MRVGGEAAIDVVAPARRPVPYERRALSLTSRHRRAATFPSFRPVERRDIARLPSAISKEKSVRRRLIGAAVALLAAVTLVGCSSGSDATTLRVGTEGTYSPFSFQGTDGKLTGYDIEVIQAVGAKLGKTVEFVQTPWDSIFAGLEAKRFDLVANQVTVNDERKGKYDLSEPYTVSEGVIVTRADNAAIKTLADLKGKTTAQSATSNWAKVAKDAGANVEAVEGFVQAVRLLKDGRVDATVNDTLAVGEYQKTTNDTGVKVAGTTGDTSEQAFAARKNSGLIADVNRALGELRTDGTIKKISEKYFGTDVSSK
jgi:cystine transport system substrate-binding protein